MSTIDELIDKWIPEKKFVQDGTFKVKRTNWEGYFIPYYKADSIWHGIGDNGKSEWYNADVESLEIYTEPKKKVKHWLWTYLGVVKFGSSNPGGSAIDAKWKKIPGTEVEI